MRTQQTRVLMKLRDMILKGQFAPGERLAEIPLAERLDASRTPVRLALAALEHEGLIEPMSGGGYRMRGFTRKEVRDSIELRGVLEGTAARLLAEKGASRELLRQLEACLDLGDKAVNKESMALDDYATYAKMNQRFHDLIIEGSDNFALARTIEVLNGQPFASASAMLPMQSSLDVGHRWMQYAQMQHHAILQAIKNGQGGRAQALGQEHVEIALWNFEIASESPEKVESLLPSIRLLESENDHGF